MASVPTALALPALSTRHPRRRRHLLLRPCSLSSSAASSSSSVPLLGSLAPKSRSVCRYAGNYEKDFHSDHKGSNKMGSDLIEIESISYLMEEEDVLINMIPKRASLGRVTNPKFDIFNGLKFAVLSGLLTFQGCQHATAITEIASGLQPASFIGDLGDIGTGFTSAFLLIFFSELGDKTFFIAALLAARNSALVVFLGTFGALGVMTIISVILGRTFHYVDDILPFRFGETDLPVDDIAAVCLLVYFGVSTLIDASSSDGSKAQGEKEEAELAIADVSGSGAGIVAAASTVISTFALVFVAEWGDKSFFSTIALAAASSPLGVVGAPWPAMPLQPCCGGSLLGTFFSEKVIAYVGGLLFLVFAAVTLSGIVS